MIVNSVVVINIIFFFDTFLIYFIQFNILLVENNLIYLHLFYILKYKYIIIYCKILFYKKLITFEKKKMYETLNLE